MNHGVSCGIVRRIIRDEKVCFQFNPNHMEKNETSAPARGFLPSVQNMGLRPRESATRFLSLGGYNGFKYFGFGRIRANHE